uniref:Uncharacterized protein n=1 Tax=Heterorhabditis bacteriophora TaxID=37862 RepID=A0A1I7W771_HETBA
MIRYILDHLLHSFDFRTISLFSCYLRNVNFIIFPYCSYQWLVVVFWQMT